MEQFEGLTVAQIVQEVTSLLKCSVTAGDVATYLDEHDELRHLRQEFLVPKNADLPCSESEVMKLTFSGRFNHMIISRCLRL